MRHQNEEKNLVFLVGLRIDKKLNANLPQNLFLSHFLDKSKIPKKHKKYCRRKGKGIHVWLL